MANDLKDSLKKALGVLNTVVVDISGEAEKEVNGLGEGDRKILRKQLSKNPQYIQAKKDLKNLNIKNLDIESWL